jgi:CBS domain-containing protein
MTSGELCIRRVITADRDETVVDAARRMTEENVGDLVVVERAADVTKPIGIVTDRDLVAGALARGTSEALGLRIADVMSELVTIYDDEPIERAFAKLRTYRIRRLPVVDRSGALQGIVTLDDLVAWIREQLDDAASVIDRQSELGASARTAPA